MGDIGDKGRHLGKADTPSNTFTFVGETMGDQGRQEMGGTGGKGDKGRHEETRGDKTSGRRTYHPTQAHMWGTMGEQGR